VVMRPRAAVQRLCLLVCDAQNARAVVEPVVKPQTSARRACGPGARRARGE